MIREAAAPDMVLMGAVVGLGLVGILTPREVFSGFANPVVAVVGALFIVSAAVRETGALDMTTGRLLAGARDVPGGIARISVPVAVLSAFLNNAPIVAMMTPTITDWAKRLGLSPSRFLIPLSYASILGSLNTIIGTSVILTVAGLVTDAEMEPLGFFELLPVAAPITAVGLVYLVALAWRRIPDRIDPAEALGQRRREYTTAMRVMPDSPLVGSTIEEAGLRNLPGLFVVELDRGERVITPVTPDQGILAGDELVFAGVVSTIVDLQRIRGLEPVAHEDDEDAGAGPGPTHRLVEAVVSESSPMVGRSVRDLGFRSAYDAAVVAVHRNAEHVPGKIGEIVLRPGDVLLMQAAPDFVRTQRNNTDFTLISELPESERPRHDRAWVALAVLALMVVAVASGVAPISIAAFVAVGALLTTRCISASQARRAIRWPILVVIAAGLGLATAMQKTGAAAQIANLLVSSVASLGPMGVLAVVYALCILMAEMLQHNAAVAIMFPIAVAAADQLGVDARPFVIATAIGSACAFASPVSYQTHLIVYGAGGYRFGDFVRVGLPLDLVCGAVAVTVIPRVWPF
jgi:di/tricarboxylate transporter